jgi:Flp pilus assembly protein TadG
MRNRLQKKSGIIAVLVAVSLIAILGIAALAIDSGKVLDEKRQLQAAADAAALAAADDLFTNYAANAGADPSGTAKASALSTASADGFNNNGTTNNVTVNIPPASGIANGKNGYAEVIIQLNQTRSFSNIFGSGAVSVTARAVAGGNPGNVGILVLDPHLESAADIEGNVNILNNGQIYCNSDNTVPNDSASPNSGSIYLASTANLQVAGINIISGGALNNAGGINYVDNGGLSYYNGALADPLANIPEPTTAGLTSYGDVTITSNTTLQPGIYGNITIQSDGGSGGWGSGGGGGGGGGWGGGGGGGGGGSTNPVVTMAPGIYYLSNGGSLVLSAGTLQGTGVMFFDNTGGDNVLNTASGVVNITPPTPASGGSWPTGTTASTYNGISFWVPRAVTSEVHIISTSNVTMPGTWYAQGGEYDFRPDGASTVFNMGNYICDQAEWCQGYDAATNTSNGTVNMDPTTAAPTQRPTLVE